MQDHDREPVRERETERNTTTIITDDGERRGGGGVLIAILVLILLAVLAFFLLGDGLSERGGEGDINVNIDAPEVTVPDVELPEVDANPPAEDSGGSGNAS